jgi:hypothetical protein
MIAYNWAGDASPLTNSISQLPAGSVGVGGLPPGSTTLMGDGKTPLNDKFHSWDWVLLANRNVDLGVPGEFNQDTVCKIYAVLDSTFQVGACTPTPPPGTGIFNTYQPTPATDLFVDDELHNRLAGQYAYANSTTVPRVDYDTTVPFSSNPYFPYNMLPDPQWLWRIQPDVNGYSRFTNEDVSYLMLSNHDNDPWVELLTPSYTLNSFEWSLVSVSNTNYVEIISRAAPSGRGLNVQNQKGYVEESTVQSTWTSADWTISPMPSGLCCTNLTSSVSCPAGSKPCPCGTTNCPAFTP